MKGQMKKFVDLIAPMENAFGGKYILIPSGPPFLRRRSGVGGFHGLGQSAGHD